MEHRAIQREERSFTEISWQLWLWAVTAGAHLVDHWSWDGLRWTEMDCWLHSVCLFTVWARTVGLSLGVYHDWCMTGHSGTVGQSSLHQPPQTLHGHQRDPSYPLLILILHHHQPSQSYHYQLNILSASPSFQHNNYITPLLSPPVSRKKKNNILFYQFNERKIFQLSDMNPWCVKYM